MNDQERKKHLIDNSKKTLTNYFTGNIMGNLNNSITDRFQAIIQNGLSGQHVLVALSTANFDTLGFNTDLSTHHFFAKHHHDLADIKKAGYTPDVIFDDLGDNATTSPYAQTNAVSVTKNNVTGNVTMETTSGKTVASMKEHLRQNPRFIKRITISAVTTSDQKECPEAFNASMFMASVNPFQHEAAKEIDLSQYFQTNQFQSGKIVINYAKEELQWNDMLLWMIEVRSGCTMKITVDFYNE